jgi:hypothetical protein
MVLMLGRPPALLLPLLRPIATLEEASMVEGTAGQGTEKEMGGGKRATLAARETPDGLGRAEAGAVPGDEPDSRRPGATAALLREAELERRECTSTVSAAVARLRTTVPEAAVGEAEVGLTADDWRILAGKCALLPGCFARVAARKHRMAGARRYALEVPSAKSAPVPREHEVRI